MLRGAEQLFGIELTDAQKQMALQNVNSNLERYETLRKINVPLDTEPATLFHPALPGKRFNVKAATFKLGKIERLNFSNDRRSGFCHCAAARGLDPQPQDLLNRSHQDVSRTLEALRTKTQLHGDAH